MVIKGFNTKGGQFVGIPANKITVCLPSCICINGFTDTLSVKKAINYLTGKESRPGNYTLLQLGGYPNIAGMTTWSINWDNLNNYDYAKNFKKIFEIKTTTPKVENSVWKFYPNPVHNYLIIQGEDRPSVVEIYTSTGSLIYILTVSNNPVKIDFSNFSKGTYILKYKKGQLKIVKK